MNYEFKLNKLIIEFSKISRNFKWNQKNVINLRVRIINENFNININVK